MDEEGEKEAPKGWVEVFLAIRTKQLEGFFCTSQGECYDSQVESKGHQLVT